MKAHNSGLSIGKLNFSMSEKITKTEVQEKKETHNEASQRGMKVNTTETHKNKLGSPGTLDSILESDEEDMNLSETQRGNTLLQEFHKESRLLAVKVHTIADAHTKHVTLDGNSLAVEDLPDIYPKHF